MRHVSAATYQGVLDKVFARDRLARSCNLFLRFEPSSRPESQIAIRKSLTATEVSELVLADSTGVGNSLARLVQSGAREDVDEMARKFSVRTRIVHVPDAQVTVWINGLFESLPAAFPVLRSERQRAEREQLQSMMMDGTRYSIWYSQGPIQQYQLAFSFDDYDADGKPGGALAVTKWMNTIRRAVEQSK
jgi:hypothetical protein